MKRLSQKEYKEKVESKTNGEYTIASEYQGMEKPIKIKHNKCGRIYDLKYASTGYYQKLSCTECTYSYVDRDYPWLAVNFKNQSETHIPKSSKKEVELICPCCEKTVTMKVYQYVRAGHVRCDTCGDGYPYCEKFVANVLHQVGIKPKRQFSPEWLGDYRYDFQFDLNDNKYIVETDGGIGHGYTTAYGTDKNTSLEKDRLKDNLAVQHGYKVIRINCHYENKNRMAFVKENVIKELSEIIDLTNIDWDKCNLFATTSLFKSVVDVYKNETKYVEEIAKKVGIKERTVEKYIADAMNNGIISKEIIHNKKPIEGLPIELIRLTDTYADSEPVYCYEDALLFHSIKDASIYYGNGKNGLYAAMSKYNGSYKGRHFAYLKDLPKDFDFKKFIFPDDEYDGHMICQYTLDGNLTKVYFRQNELPLGIKYNNVWRAANNKRATAYGYKWRFLTKQDEMDIYNLIPKENALGRSYFYAQ